MSKFSAPMRSSFAGHLRNAGLSILVLTGTLFWISVGTPSSAVASEFSDRVEPLIVNRNAFEFRFAPAPTAPTTGEQWVERAKKLKLGALQEPNNPFRKIETNGVEEALENALRLPGSHRIDASNMLADLLLERRKDPKEVQRAVALLEANAAQGDPEAKLTLARMIGDGVDMPADAARRRLLLEEALTAGEPQAALELATLAPDAASRDGYLRQGIFLLRVKARNSATARRELARVYLSGNAVISANLAKATQLYREAIAMGDLQSGPELAVELLKGSKGPADPELARLILEESIVVGSRQATHLLIKDAMTAGPMLFEAADAFELLNKLDSIGDIKATFLLAISYKNGVGTERSLERSEQILARLTAPGSIDPAVLMSFARALRDGKDIPGDKRLAERFFRTAAEAGYADGMFEYARLVLARGAEPEETRIAIGFLERAAEMDHFRSLIALGDIYRDGTGVEVSRDHAGQYYDRAIRLTDSSVALERRGNLLLRVGASPRAAARGLAFLQRAASKGSSAAMLDLGRTYFAGKTIAVNANLGVEWMDKARAAGNIDAAVELGQYLETLGASDQRRSRIPGLYKEAYEKGASSAAPPYARLLLAQGQADDAVKVLSAAASTGYAPAISDLVGLYLERGDKDQARSTFERGVGWTSDQADQAADFCSRLMRAQDPVIQEKAADLASRLSDQGNSAAASALALAYFTGDGREKNIDNAIRLATKAGELGDIEQLYDIAFALLKGDGVDEASEKAVGLLEEIHRRFPHHVGTLNTLAEALRLGRGAKQDPQRSVLLLREAALKESSSAALALGNAYLTGSGVERDPAEAVRWYERSAALGSADAALLIANASVSGEGDGVNPEKAFASYRRLAETGSTAAMVAVARAYLAGYGVQRDTQNGLQWLDRATKAGDPTAMFDLYHYYQTRGDDARAMEALNAASSGGSADARFKLAMLYRDGHGVPQSDAQMMHWLKLAADQGQEYAHKLLGRVDRVGTVNVLKVAPVEH